MNYSEIISFLSSEYHSLSEPCIQDIEKHFILKEFQHNKIIVREGQLSDKLYFVAEGAVRAYYLKDEKDITDWFAFEGDFICAINSYFLKVPSPHYLETIGKTVLLELPREKVQSLSDTHADFEKLKSAVLTKVMLQLQQRIVSLQFETAQQKYENLLKTRPDITQKIPLTHIASFLGITLETLSRIRNPKNRI